MRRLFPGLAFIGALFAATEAKAHFVLNYPPGRSTEIDNSPCGPAGSTRGTNVTNFRPGETIVLKWQVFVEHTTPGQYRIAIDDSGQDFPLPVGPNDTSTLPFFMDHVEASGETAHELQITLPNIQCSDCTLQMLQYKLPKPPYDPMAFYFQCADITISGDPVGGTSTGTGGGGSGNAGAGAGGAATGGAGSTSTTSGATSTTSGAGQAEGAHAPAESAGCSVAPLGGRTGTTSSAACILSLALLWLRPRRRR